MEFGFLISVGTLIHYLHIFRVCTVIDIVLATVLKLSWKSYVCAY